MAVDQLLALPDPPTAVFVENTFVSASLLYPIQASEPELPPAIARLDMVHFEAWDLAFVEQVMNGIFLYPSRRSKLLQVNWMQMGRVASKRMADLMIRPHSGGEVIRLAPRLVEVAGSDVSPL